MPSNYDKIDLRYTWNGDFLPSEEGDLADTSIDQIQTVIEMIQLVVNSAVADWREHTGLGAGLEDFIGEPNLRETGDQIRDRIKSTLVINNIVREQDLSINITPVGNHAVLIIIKLAALATPQNSMEDNVATISLVFDYNERGIFFLEDQE